MDTQKASALEQNNNQQPSAERSHNENFEVRRSQEHESHLETSTERHKESERAKQEALEIATKSTKTEKADDALAQKSERRGAITKHQLEREFTTTMKHACEDMSPAERTFSKFIHLPAIEKTSDFLSATVARPNALLAGSAGAFVLTLAVYLFAKSFGYPLSGFEPIAAFIIGWIIGMLYDYFRIMATGKH